eukprot:SAG11_NODE_353_length_10348_cov_6.938335_7_plen_385_part_00
MFVQGIATMSPCMPYTLRARLEEPVNTTTNVFACAKYHRGRLCAECIKDYSHKASDSTCIDCHGWNGDHIEEQFGLRPWQLIGIGLVVAALVASIVWSRREWIAWLRAEVYANVRIVLGLLQVLSLLREVLDVIWPPSAQQTLSYVALLTVDIRSLLSLDCYMGWYTRWLLNTFVLPTVGFTCVGGTLAFRIWRARQRQASTVTAWADSSSQAFFVVMLLYPRISSSIFEALRCRGLGPAGYPAVLEVDYAIECLDDNGDEPARYRKYKWCARCLVALWPIGIPLAMLAALYWHWLRSCTLWATYERASADGAENRAVYTFDAVGPVQPQSFENLEGFHAARTRRDYKSVAEDFRDGCFWYEPVNCKFAPQCVQCSQLGATLPI